MFEKFFSVKELNINNKIGEGGFGCIYSIKNKIDGKFFVIKELKDQGE